jgi:GntR family transcriptional regulator
VCYITNTPKRRDLRGGAVNQREYDMGTLQQHWNEDQPIYRQLRDRLMEMILDRVIEEGDAMPSVRQISVELKINPITVTRAVQELEECGALEKRRGLGNFVKPGAREQLLQQERKKFLKEDWPALRAKLERLQISLESLQNAIA